MNYNTSNRKSFNGVEAQSPCITIAILPTLASRLSWCHTVYFNLLETSGEGLHLTWPELKAIKDFVSLLRTLLQPSFDLNFCGWPQALKHNPYAVKIISYSPFEILTFKYHWSFPFFPVIQIVQPVSDNFLKCILAIFEDMAFSWIYNNQSHTFHSKIVHGAGTPGVQNEHYCKCIWIHQI